MASQRAASSRVRSDASLIADVSATLCRDLGLGAVNKSLGKRAVSDAIRFSGRYAQFLEKVRGTGDVSEPVAKQIHEQVARRVDLAVKQLQHEAKSSGAGGGGIAVAGFGTVGNVERLPGTISGAAGGLIAGGLMKPTKRSRSGQQKGSSLGLDRLARAKRDQNGVGDRVAAAQKRRRMQGMSMALSVDGDDDDAGRPGGVDIHEGGCGNVQKGGSDGEARHRAPCVLQGASDGERKGVCQVHGGRQIGRAHV
jgi:hypothetical protein